MIHIRFSEVGTKKREYFDYFVFCHDNNNVCICAVFPGHGPTWYRGYAHEDGNICSVLDEALHFLQVNER